MVEKEFKSKIPTQTYYFFNSSRNFGNQNVNSIRFFSGINQNTAGAPCLWA